MSPRMISELGDVSGFIRGITFKPEDVVPIGESGSIACMRTKNVQTQIDIDDVWAVSERFVNREDQLLQEGDLLVSTANSSNIVGKGCWVPELPWKTTLGGFISVLRPDRSKVAPRFLFHWYTTPWVQAEVRACGRKTTSISNLDLDRVLRLPFPNVALPEQRRIAAILDQAEALRTKRRAALTKLDTLAQSIFIEMFGDPVLNPKNWPLMVLGDVGTLDRGVSKHRPRNAPELLGGEYPLVQTGEISSCDGYIRKFTNTYSEVGLRQSKIWPAGTLCITIAANIAKTGILTFDACFPDSVVGFTSDDPATTEYVRIWLSFLQKTLEESAPESAQKNINLAILRELEIPLPPKHYQRTFAERLQATEAVRIRQRASLAHLDALFASLQHRAFRGEL